MVSDGYGVWNVFRDLTHVHEILTSCFPPEYFLIYYHLPCIGYYIDRILLFFRLGLVFVVAPTTTKGKGPGS